MTEYSGAHPGEFDDVHSSSRAHPAGAAANAVPFGRSPESPTNLDELVLQVQWLAYRVQALEAAVARQQTSMGLHSLRHLSYHIDKLYVKELSGTLNIGISSSGGGLGLDGIVGSAGVPEAFGQNGLSGQFGQAGAAGGAPYSGPYVQPGHDGKPAWGDSFGGGGVYDEPETDEEEWV